MRISSSVGDRAFRERTPKVQDQDRPKDLVKGR